MLAIVPAAPGIPAMPRFASPSTHLTDPVFRLPHRL